MDEQITEIQSDGSIRACNICGNPTPGMSHKCTDYLKAKILTLQATNTKLVLRVRKLEESMEGLRKLSSKAIGYLQRIAELEQDGKRLDWLEKAQPNQWHEVTNNFETWDLRQALDEAMVGGE